MKQVTIYTDGSAVPNPGRGGWAAKLIFNGTSKLVSGRIPYATNNQAELIAVIEALKLLKEPCEVTIISDSQLIVNCIKGAWQRKANPDLWEKFAHFETTHMIFAQWVKGHDGDPNNEDVHRAAEKAANHG